MANMMDPDFKKDAVARYAIDNAASKFSVQAFAGGLLSSFGHDPVISIASFSGEARLPEDLSFASLSLTIQAASLKVISDIGEKDRREIERLMHEQVLQSDQYSEIVYSCSRASASQTGEGQYWVALNGELTLHGVTRGLTVPTRVTVNGDALRGKGTFTILQSDYEIAPVSVGAGSLKVKDELKFSFDIVARKQV